MVQYYIRAMQKYLDSHPGSKITKLFDNAYDWFTSAIFTDGERQFHVKFGATPLFKDDAIDTKALLEQEFGITL